ncbi:MAG: HEAT repeat domain-containing protein [Cyanobacteriota bacterium]|nr:HEAT repeat domain-containing protein [Cyanobacteriota bacterium]
MWIPYLESVCRDYAKWWEVYTLTDVRGKKSLQQQQHISPLLDLGLMVQTVESEEKQRERQEEKIERLTVLEGLRKYAPNHVLLVGRPGSGKSTALARLLLEEAEKLRSSIGLPLGSREIRETLLLEEVEKLRSPLSPPLGRGETGETPAFQSKAEGQIRETPLGIGETRETPPLVTEETRKTPPLRRGVGGDRKIPILIELRYSQSSILSRIQAFIHKHHPTLNIDTATLETLLRQGEFLLLFDGFNEMASEAARQQVRMFRQDYPKTAMVFTTRDLSLGGDLGIEKRLEMQPLTESQMQEFVCAYLPEHGEKLWQQLQGRLRELGETPMFLWMLCSVFGYNKVIPANLGLVFRSFTQTYSSRLKQDVPVDESSRRWWDRLLQELAWVMTNGESQTEIMVAISRQKAESVLTEFLRGEVVAPTDCAMRWLEDLLEHHLIQVGDDGQISFRHQLLQEYYAAERLLWQLSGLSDYELQWEYLNYLKWTEVVALMLGLVEDEVLAVRVVRLALEVDWFLGATLVGEVQRRFQEQAFGEVEQLELPVLVKVRLAGLTKSDAAVPGLVKLLEDSDSDVRESAADALGKICSETVIPKLLPLLNDLDSDIAWSAVYALGKIIWETAIEALIELLKHSDSEVRSNAAEVLGKIASETAVPALIQLLEHSDSDNVPICAAEALGKIGSETAIPALIQVLKYSDSNNDNVRISAAEALGKIGSETAIPALIQVLKYSDYAVGMTVAEALGEIGSETAIPALIQILKYSDYAVGMNAAEALGKIGSETVIMELIHLLEDSNSNVRKSAAEVLGQIGSETAIPKLIHLLEDSNSSVRLDAAFSLSQISWETAISGLIKLLEDSERYVRWRAAEALGEIGSETAIPELIKLLEDSEEYVRTCAAWALVRIGSENAVEGLIPFLEHSDRYVRNHAAFTMGKIGSEKAIEGLIPLLEHSNKYVRRNTADVMGQIGSETAIPGLIKLLEDSDYGIRWKAAEALGKIGSETAIPELILLLEDSDSVVRSRAAEALGKIGSETAIPGLIKLLEDSNSGVHSYAAEALGKIGSETVIPELILLLEDSDQDVRLRAAEALGEIGMVPEKSENVIPVLIQFLEDSNKYMRRRAAEALSKIGSETVIPGLDTSKNTDLGTAESGFEDLFWRGILTVLLDESDSDVRRIAVSTISKIGSENTIVELTQKLQNSSFVKQSLSETIDIIQTIQKRLRYYKPTPENIHL